MLFTPCLLALGIFVVAVFAFCSLFPFFHVCACAVYMCLHMCVQVCVPVNMHAEVVERIDPAKGKVPKSQVPGGETSGRVPAPFRAPPPGAGLRTRSLILHGTPLPALGRPGGGCRRLPERPRSQRSRERPVRDPAEVSGPGRFSRRRGRGPFVNYLLDNILPKVPLGRSRLPCKSPLHTRGFQVENVGFSGADGTQPPCPSAMDAAATFPGKEREKSQN